MIYSRTKFDEFWGVVGNDIDSAKNISVLFNNELKRMLDVILAGLENNEVEEIFFELDKLKGTLTCLGFADEAALVEMFEGTFLEPYCWVKLNSDFFILTKQLTSLKRGVEQEINHMCHRSQKKI